MLVKILKQNDEYCIVRAYKTEELTELGYKTSEIYNMKNIEYGNSKTKSINL